MAGKLFLSGGGSKEQSFDVDRIFFENINNVLYIPWARKVEKFPKCLEWFTDLVKAHKDIKIDMLTDPKSDIDLAEYDAIYIGGGNTYRLLKKIKESKFDKKLLEYYNNGGIVYGGSAGAIIWGNDIDLSSIGADSDENDSNLEDMRGFNVVNGADVQCHFTESILANHKNYFEKTKRPIIAIPEVSALLVEGNKFKVIGKEALSLIGKNGVKTFEVNSLLVL